MKFTALLENIKKNLFFSERALGKSLNLPILSSFLIEAFKNEVRVSATNLEVGVKSSFPAKIEKEGKMVIPAKALIAFLSQINEVKIDFTTDDKKLKLKTENYEAEFQGLDPEEFPIIPEVKDKKVFKIESSFFAKALEQVIVASSRSDFRPELASIFLSFLPIRGLKLAATDTFRLSEKTIGLDDFQPLTKEGFSCLLPLKTAEELIKILKEKLEPVEISLDQNQVEFSWKETTLVSRLLEGEFPDYDQIIPRDFESQGLVFHQKLIEALKISGIFASKLNDVKLNFSVKNKKIFLNSSDNFSGKNQSKIDLESAKGNDLEIVFNYRFLLDGLSVIDQKDRLFLGLIPEKPALIKNQSDPSFIYILMPLRL